MRETSRLSTLQPGADASLVFRHSTPSVLRESGLYDAVITWDAPSRWAEKGGEQEYELWEGKSPPVSPNGLEF